MIPVVAYARFSSENQRDESISAQLRAIQEYCSTHEYNLVKAYTDEAKSATSDQRPEFKQLIHDSASGAFRYVVVHKLDRFSRDRYDSAIYKRKLKQNGVRLLSVLEHLDDSPESVILESVLEGMAEYYSRNLSRETLKGLYENAYKCKHNGGTPPLGFNVTCDKTYTINPREAEAVRLIFDMYAKGAGYHNIIDALKVQGYKTKTGKDFSQTSLNAILRNEKYNGVYVFGRTKPQSKTGARTNASRPENEILKIPGGMPRIVDADSWDTVQRLRKEKATMAGKGAAAAKEIYLLTGLLKCGECGSDMHGEHMHHKAKNKTYIKYRCSGKKRAINSCGMPNVDRDRIEDAVLDFIETEVFKKDIIEQITDKLAAIIQETELEKRSTGIAKELKETEVKIDNAVSAVLSGLNSPAIAATLKNLEDHKAALTAELAKAQIEEAATPEVTASKIKAFVDKHRNLRSKTRQEQKTTIRMFIDKIVVFYEDDTWRIDIYPVKGTSYGPSPQYTVALTVLVKNVYTIRL